MESSAYDEYKKHYKRRSVSLNNETLWYNMLCSFVFLYIYVASNDLLDHLKVPRGQPLAGDMYKFSSRLGQERNNHRAPGWENATHKR